MRAIIRKSALTIVLAAAFTPLRAQQLAQGEVIHPRTHPVKFDAKLGAGVAVLSEGKLHQIAVTLIELPPGKQLAARRELAEEMIYIVAGKEIGRAHV